VLKENKIRAEILDAAIEVHRTLGGPGLLESVYEEALAWQLNERGLYGERQKSVPIEYKGNQLATPLPVDILVTHLMQLKPLAPCGRGVGVRAGLACNV
jgi:GxxExxY protein